MTRPGAGLALLAAALLGAFLWGASWQKGRAAPPPPPEAVKIAAGAVKISKKAAEISENRAFVARKQVLLQEEALEAATEARARSGFSFDDLPAPAALEAEAMRGLIAAQATQIELEIQRGDSWRGAFEAAQKLVGELEARQAAAAKEAHRKGLKKGIGIGAGAALALAILL